LAIGHAEASMSIERVLVTGAAGTIGRALRHGLRGRYLILRLLDVAPQREAGPGEEVVTIDLNDRAATEAAMRDVDMVVHLAAIPHEAPFDDILAGNITTTYSVFEAARRAGVRRVVFASSHHVTGFYPRDESIGPDDPVRPDSFYGVSKVFGEALGRLYADKHGLEVVCLRIGGFGERPTRPRHLNIWLSPRDCVQLVRCSLEAPGVGFTVVYGVSANTRSWWTDDAAAALGYHPHDNAEDFVAQLEGAPSDTPSRRADWLQGGSFVEDDPAG
jgi:uronate dehydrogenase